MNKQNIALLFRNYIDNFSFFDDATTDGHETYKWTAVEQVQNTWNLSAPDLSGMIRLAFSGTYNLINNRIVSPGNGLALLAREEPDKVRKALEMLLSETQDTEEKQDHIFRFVDEINGLLEKHFPGKWKYTHDIRVAVTYLALIKPSENYLFKSTPAHYFARWMDFDTDMGYGTDFKLKYYYQMCDELLAEVNACPELLAKDAQRKCTWRDNSNHLLVTDLIYCFHTYGFMQSGLSEPENRKSSSSVSQQAQKAKRAVELQEALDRLQDEIDAVEKEISTMPGFDFAGKTVKTKLFGDVTITRQEGNYLTFTAEGKECLYALPNCITNGFLIPDDQAILERYKQEAELQEKLQKLNAEQRLANMDLRKY